jgi:tetratricopeptide (TPR) repeat protein
MSASLLARRMVDGLSDTARAEMDATLADLSAGGRSDLVAVFRSLLDGQDMSVALGLPAGTADLLYAQAHARFNAGNVTDALALFQALAALSPKVKDHWLGLGICLRMTGVFAGARLAFAAALDLQPDCAAVTYHLAELALADGRREEAVVLVRRFFALPDGGLKTRLSAEAQRLAAVLTAS